MEREQHPRTEKPSWPEVQLERIGLNRFIRELYPQCRGNRVADFVTQIASDLEDSLAKNPFDFKRSETSAQSYLGIRGSSVKRQVLGTPPGYWRVSEYYQRIPPFEQKDFDPLTGEVVEKLSTGPHDLDIIFRPKADLSVLDILPVVAQSLKTQGFFVVEQKPDEIILDKTGRRLKEPYDDYKVTLKYFAIGGQRSLPVEGVVIKFNYSGQPVLKVDLIKGPKNEELYNNFRLVGCMAPFDLFSLGHIHKTKDGKMLVDYDTELANLDSPSLVKLYYQTDPDLFLNSFNARLRVVYQRTLWFNNFKDPAQARFGNYSLPTILKQFNLGWLDRHPYTKEEWLKRLCSEEQFNKLQARLGDIISGFLVGLTYDPFLFLKLASESKLLSFLPISEFVRTREGLEKIIGLMARNYGPQKLGPFTYKSFEELYHQDPTTTLPLLSKEYQSSILYRQPGYGEIKYTGPFIFLRALNKLIEESGQTPLQESLPTVVSLFNPLVFYLQNSGQGIPVSLDAPPTKDQTSPTNLEQFGFRI